VQRDVSISLNRLGHVLIAQGDLGGARARFQDSLDIAKRLAAADPSSAELQRAVSISLIKLGDVHIAQGDLAGARTRFQDSLDIRKRLAEADPSSAESQRDLVVSLVKLAQVPGSGVRWRQVAEQVERMRLRGILAPGDIWMVEESRKEAAEQDGSSKQP
jgi:Flp pilus assembly protein TadD